MSYSDRYQVLVQYHGAMESAYGAGFPSKSKAIEVAAGIVRRDKTGNELQKLTVYDRDDDIIVKEWSDIGDSRSGPVTLESRTRTKRDLVNGTWTILVFSDGSKHGIQRQNAAEAFGLGGWHLIDDPSARNTWLADSEKDAIAVLLERKNR